MLEKKKKKPMIITFLHLWQKHLGLLYSNVAGLAVVLQLGGDLLDKKHLFSEIWWTKSTYLKIQIHESTRLCQDSVFCTCTWETTCFKFWSSMYLSCTCKDFFTNLYKDFCAEGDKCLWNNWVGGGGEKGRKK